MNTEPVQVLLVEDDEDDYFITIDLLSYFRGSSLGLPGVATYEEALDVVRRSQHDICLVGYPLCKPNGWNLLYEVIRH